MTKNQHGYTMLLAIGCLLIVTILGLSLMRITSNAYSKNENRSDNIQADALATKGADLIVAELNYLLEKKGNEVKKKVKDEADLAFNEKRAYDGYGKIKEYLIAGFDQILNDFSCDNPVFMAKSTKDSIVNHIDKYGYCVKLDPRIANPTATVPAITDDPLTWYTVKVPDTDGLQQIVTLRSKGDVGAGKAETDLYLRKVIGLTLDSTPESGQAPGDGGGGTIGETITDGLNNVADIPVALEYALTTKKSGKANNHHEDGAVFLHGGIDIFGGLNIDGNLYVGNYGMPGYNSYIYSSYPRVFEHDKTLTYNASLVLRKPGAVNVKGDVIRWNKVNPYYTFGGKEHDKYLIDPNNFRNHYNLENVVDGNGFSNKGVSVKAYDSDAQEFDVNFTDLKNHVINALTVNETSENSCEVSKSKNDIKGNFVYCNNLVEVTKSNVVLKVDKIQSTKSDLASRGGIAYLKGLTIKNKTVTMQGTFFVDGDITIDESTIIADAVIYVTGKVNIDGSNINSLTYTLDGKEQQGTLLFFSEKTIDLNGISVNSPTPSDMKAFLYSKQDIEITGSTSHVLINGGISARSIELTGMRGPNSDHNKSVWKSSCSKMSELKYCQNITNLTDLWSYYTDPEYNEKIQKKIKELQKEIDKVDNQITGVQKEIVELQPRSTELKNQIDGINSQIKSIENQLKDKKLSDKRRRELESQKRTLESQKSTLEKQKKTLDTQIKNLEAKKKTYNTQKVTYENQIKELEKPVDAEIATLEKQMRSRLTVYYNPDIIITYKQHGVEVKPAEVPDFTITIPSDYDRIKK